MIPPVTPIDHRAVVRLRIQQKRCPHCGAACAPRCILCAACVGTVKYCGRCETVKPLADFQRNAHCADGLHCYCRPCKQAHDKQRYARNSEAGRAAAVVRRTRLRTARGKHTRTLADLQDERAYILRYVRVWWAKGETFAQIAGRLGLSYRQLYMFCYRRRKQKQQ